MYHDIANDKTKEYIERFPELKKGLIELCHAFKFKVLTHNHKEMVKYETTVIANSGETPSGQRYIRNHLRFLLVDSGNIPVGVFFTKDATNKENEYAVAYHFTSELIAKDRGRGLDRRTRESINIPALIKSLKKDGLQNTHMIRNSIGRQMWYDVESGINTAVGGRYRHISLDTDTQAALIDMFLNNKMVTDARVITDIKRNKEALDYNQKTKDEREEVLGTFKKAVSFIYYNEECPMMIGRASHSCDQNGDNSTFLIHPDVKCYLSPDDVPDEYRQLMVDFKMWFVKHEKDYLVREIESNTQFKVLPICDDGYDRDLNIVAGCGSIHALNPFSDYHTFIVPHIEYVNE